MEEILKGISGSIIGGTPAGIFHKNRDEIPEGTIVGISNETLAKIPEGIPCRFSVGTSEGTFDRIAEENSGGNMELLKKETLQ